MNKFKKYTGLNIILLFVLFLLLITCIIVLFFCNVDKYAKVQYSIYLIGSLYILITLIKIPEK